MGAGQLSVLIVFLATIRVSALTRLPDFFGARHVKSEQMMNSFPR